MPNYNDNNSRRSKFFYASRRTKTPSNIHKQSQKYSSKCLCDKCDVSNCQFRGQYENHIMERKRNSCGRKKALSTGCLPVVLM